VFARGLPHSSFIADCRSRCKPSNIQYGYMALEASRTGTISC
jgi:hypothetical protein